MLVAGELGKAGCRSCACSEAISTLLCQAFPQPRGNRENVGTADAAHSRQRPSQTCLLAASRAPFRGDHSSCQGHPGLSCAAQMSLVWPRAAHTAQHTPDTAEEEPLPAPACRPGAVAPSEVQDTAC